MAREDVRDERAHTNFILLGHARCGSNLLLRALAEHPQVRVAGELLGPDEATRAAAWQRVNRNAWPLERGEGYRTGEDAAGFLRERVFSDRADENILAFGFKIFYDHAQADAAMRRAWAYLMESDVRVIHLVRRNLLETLISREVAMRSQAWFRTVEQGPGPAQAVAAFALEPEYCRAYFEELTEQKRRAKEAFAGHRVLDLEYERDLCGDFSGTTLRVFEFLDVMRWYSRPGMLKQQGVAASEQVSNFAELRRKFAGTEFAEFFEA